MQLDRRTLLTVTAALATGSVAGCLGDSAGRSDAQLLSSNADFETNPDVDDATLDELVRENNGFAVDLFHELVDGSDANQFVSPYSISIALAMTWAGARSETETQMADTLRFTLGQDDLHPAFNALDQELASRGDANTEDEPFQLNVANAIWGLEAYPYRDDFLDTLAQQYDAGLRAVDFKENPESARKTINDWVADETNDKIEDLLPKGSVDELTRLVLTNAIYFQANWQQTFSKNETSDEDFTALDESASTVPMMTQSAKFPYAEVDGHQLIELPYVGGNVSMVVVLPAEGEFRSFEQSLTAGQLADLFGELEWQAGRISLPRFTFRSKFKLKDALSALGMPVAFDEQEADFSGIADIEETGENLHIDDVYHDSFVAVDEEGTEAAAATGVVMDTESAPSNPFEMTVDRPFLFCIRDRPTGTALFLGRVTDAGAAQ